jgi:putative membrane protein
MGDILANLYPWTKAFHIMAVVSWMAGLFYLPRVYVYHVEQAMNVENAQPIFQMMEEKLFRVIIRPSMIATWVFGLALVFTPGIVDWSEIWPWTKAVSVIAMTGFHEWLNVQRRKLLNDTNTLTGRQYRIMNEVPTILMFIIVISVVVKF